MIFQLMFCFLTLAVFHMFYGCARLHRNRCCKAPLLNIFRTLYKYLIYYYYYYYYTYNIVGIKFRDFCRFTKIKCLHKTQTNVIYKCHVVASSAGKCLSCLGMSCNFTWYLISFYYHCSAVGFKFLWLLNK